jgi:serine/threonine protein kinase
MYSTYQFAPKRSSVSQFNRVVENELYRDANVDSFTSSVYSAPPSVLAEELVVGKLIGEGAHGRVHRGVFKGRDVAVKLLVSTSAAASDALRKEAALMSALPVHKHVVELVACLERPSLCLCVEFCSGGSVDSFLRAHKARARRVLRWARQAADGVAHLHAHNIVHRDLATRNLLLTFDNDVKVADFGMSRDVVDDQGTTRTAVGPLRWMAVESMVDKRFSTKSDAWMFAVTLWEFFSSAALPFAELDPAQVAIAVVKDDLRLQQPSACPDQVFALMTRCWQTDPEARPTFPEISSELRSAAKRAKQNDDDSD